MKNNKLRRLAKILITSMFVLVLFVLVGCSGNSSKSSITKLESTMNTLSNTLNNISSIESKELIIKDFMNEDNICYNDEFSFSSSNGLNAYFSSITKLNNTIVKAVETNDLIISYKVNLVAKSNQIKILCNEVLREGIKLNDDKIKSLDEINNYIISYINKIKLTKNEVNNNLAVINAVKNDYSSKTSSIIAKYNNLKASLDTRLDYYLGIDIQLDSINEIINYNMLQNVSLTQIPQDYNEVIISKTNDDKNKTSLNNDYYKNDNNFQQATQDKNIINHNHKENNGFNDNQKISNNNEKKHHFKKNIDTYEFSGNDSPYRHNNDRDAYYIYGGYNAGNMPMPYGFGGMYGMGYGMPFGYGFTYPNINTYRGYKNIDTYLKRIPKEYDEINNNEDNIVSNENSSFR